MPDKQLVKRLISDTESRRPCIFEIAGNEVRAEETRFRGNIPIETEEHRTAIINQIKRKIKFYQMVITEIKKIEPRRQEQRPREERENDDLALFEEANY